MIDSNAGASTLGIRAFAQASNDGTIRLGDATVHRPDAKVMDLRSFNASANENVAVWKEGTDTFYAVRRGTGDVTVRKAPSKVHLKNFVVDTRSSGLTSSVPACLAATGNSELFILQFETQALSGYKNSLARLGIDVHDYLGDNAYVVRADASQRETASRLPGVRGITPLHPAYKLSEALLAELSRPSLDPKPVIADLVAVSKEKKASLVRLIEHVAGKSAIINYEEGTDLLRVKLVPSQLQRIARSDLLIWMERGSLPEVDIDVARVQGGADAAQKTATGETRFDGAGLKVHILEGIEQGHPEFAGNGREPPIVVWKGDSSSHGTKTAGEIGGAGVNPKCKGLVPKAQLLYTHYTAVQNNQPNTARSRMALTEELVKKHDIDSQTASWGYARTKEYTARSRELDEILFRFDLGVTQSQSNAGNSQSRPQAWAKNVIPGLAVYHFDNADPSDDRWKGGGSTRDGAETRIGRSLSGYYDKIFTTATGGGYTSSFGGTSGGTPMVNGHLNIAIQMYKEGIFQDSLAHPEAFSEGQRPHASTMAALLMASARQYDFDGANHDMARTHQGWGFPDVERLYEMRDRMFVVNEDHSLENLERKTYTVNVASDEPELKISMVYMDPPAAVNAAKTQVNDVDLKITAPDGTVYWGNHGLLEGPYSKAGGAADTIDTVENVFVKNPQAGEWKVEVIAREINKDARTESAEDDVDFALVVLGAKKAD